MRLVVVTVGFDEKLPLRGLLRVGLDSSDTVVLVYSKTGGEFEVKKVEKAVESLKDIISKSEVKVVDLVVSGSDFYADTASILGFLREQRADEVVAVLAGGMRLLVFEVLVALMLRYWFTGARSRIYVAREDGLYDVVIPVDLLYAGLSRWEHTVLMKLLELSEMKRSQLVDEVSREYGVSESMVYKALKNLSRKNLILVEDDKVKLTEMGRLVAEAVSRS